VSNPCLSCGACCAFFRASFYWAEADDATPGGVPVDLTEKLDPYQRVMQGTNRKEPRCVALEGVVGVSVGCAIYDQRASVCREFTPSWYDGVHNPRCDQARAAKGLPALEPDAWDRPDEGLPRVA
jgi:Fe-S-cluster containining protein